MIDLGVGSPKLRHILVLGFPSLDLISLL
jgi:hypothetical protein